MGKSITDCSKRGYSSGLKDMSVEHALPIFCHRRAMAVIDKKGDDATFNEIIGLIYYQGVLDGKQIYEKNSK